jgi:8-oxo-dGTP pyrophosphatase MutT (NUDIX family)
MNDDQLLSVKALFQDRLNQLAPKPLITSEHRAHVAVIIYCNSLSQLSLITIKRAQHPLDPWSGHIALPGGMAYRNEDPLQTVLREVQEEVNLYLNPSTFLGSLDCFETISQKAGQSLLVRPEVFFVTEELDISTLRPQPSEVEQILYPSFKDLLRPDCATIYKYKKENVVLKLPARHLEVGLMWGLTYRIMTQFFECFQGLPLDLQSQQEITLENWEHYPDTLSLKKYTTR